MVKAQVLVVKGLERIKEGQKPHTGKGSVGEDFGAIRFFVKKAEEKLLHKS